MLDVFFGRITEAILCWSSKTSRVQDCLSKAYLKAFSVDLGATRSCFNFEVSKGVCNSCLPVLH